MLLKVRCFLEKRLGAMRAQEKSSVHSSRRSPPFTRSFEEKDFAATLTQEDFTNNLKTLPTSPELWAGRKEPLPLDETDLRRRKMGEPCWVATVSRPDVRARLARIASRINSLCGSDVYRINELVREVKKWQKATVLKDASSSRPLALSSLVLF